VDSARQDHCGQGRFGGLSAGAQSPGDASFPILLPATQRRVSVRQRTDTGATRIVCSSQAHRSLQEGLHHVRLRNGLPRTAILLSGSLILGLAGPALAQSTTWTSPAVTDLQVAQVSNTVLEIQRELNRLGYNAGPVDGWMGARTRAAIQAYQRDHGLLVDGQPTSSLLSHVRDTARRGRSEPALPPNRRHSRSRIPRMRSATSATTSGADPVGSPMRHGPPSGATSPTTACWHPVNPVPNCSSTCAEVSKQRRRRLLRPMPTPSPVSRASCACAATRFPASRARWTPRPVRPSANTSRDRGWR
jgi:peptidoglycan hydrolase-like protein with peptidoglycan-binding domain